MSYKVEFTLEHYDGKWVPLSGSPVLFDTIEQARNRCLKMGAVYFTCGEQQTKWMQRILDVETGEVIEHVHGFDAIERLMQSGSQTCY